VCVVIVIAIVVIVVIHGAATNTRARDAAFVVVPTAAAAAAKTVVVVGSFTGRGVGSRCRRSSTNSKYVIKFKGRIRLFAFVVRVVCVRARTKKQQQQSDAIGIVQKSSVRPSVRHVPFGAPVIVVVTRTKRHSKARL
jgi:hypothetical protein